MNPVTHLEAFFFQGYRKHVVRAGIQWGLLHCLLDEAAPGRARPCGNRAHHALVGEDHDNRVLGCIEIQSFDAQSRRQIVAAIRREENRNAQATTRGWLDEAM